MEDFVSYFKHENVFFGLIQEESSRDKVFCKICESEKLFPYITSRIYNKNLLQHFQVCMPQLIDLQMKKIFDR